MLIQVVYCHPLTDSYNHALFRTIVVALKAHGHQVAETDLYREQFDPAMSINSVAAIMQTAMTMPWCQPIPRCCAASMGSSFAFRIGGFRCRRC